MKKFLIIATIAVFLFFSAVIIINVWIVKSSDDQVFTSLKGIPEKNIGLVLGTSRYLVSGGKNPYFYNRIYAAVDLYKQGKIRHILLSGDNSSKYYNEPREMYEVLRELGIPKEAITLDFAGLRTLDSVVRSKEIFGQEKIIIVTQEFHAYRAVFIANHNDMDAVCYVADNPAYGNIRKVKYREYLARVKAFFDLYILSSEPKYLGDKEPIEIN
ncbi:MAG: ElyC/SanA/YdcF family protein [Cyclobacteriaceae bacterium]